MSKPYGSTTSLEVLEVPAKVGISQYSHVRLRRISVRENRSGVGLPGISFREEGRDCSHSCQHPQRAPREPRLTRGSSDGNEGTSFSGTVGEWT